MITFDFHKLVIKKEKTFMTRKMKKKEEKTKNISNEYSAHNI